MGSRSATIAAPGPVIGGLPRAFRQGVGVHRPTLNFVREGDLIPVTTGNLGSSQTVMRDRAVSRDPLQNHLVQSFLPWNEGKGRTWIDSQLERADTATAPIRSQLRQAQTATSNLLNGAKRAQSWGNSHLQQAQARARQAQAQLQNRARQAQAWSNSQLQQAQARARQARAQLQNRARQAQAWGSSQLQQARTAAAPLQSAARNAWNRLQSL